MSTVTFDTLKFVETLKQSGFDDEKAKGIAKAYRDAADDQGLVTKKDLPLEIMPLKIMLGIIIGGIVALIMKTFV